MTTTAADLFDRHASLTISTYMWNNHAEMKEAIVPLLDAQGLVSADIKEGIVVTRTQVILSVFERGEDGKRMYDQDGRSLTHPVVIEIPPQPSL